MRAVVAATAALLFGLGVVAPAEARMPPGHAYGHHRPGHKGGKGTIPPNLPSYCPEVPLQVLLRETLPAQLVLTCAAYY